jgi:ubiquitin-activating enzyme E1
MNGSINIESHKLCVGPDTEGTYDDFFWEDLACVVTALDNVKARLYLDSRCVAFQKPMLDSGTLGTKGNTQVVAPFLTESYGTSKDPPEQSIPVCTLKNFPHQIDHTIAWARSKFEGHFTNNANEINNYLADRDAYFAELAQDQNSELQTLQMLVKLLGSRPSDFKDCITWARRQFETEYNNNIQQLLTVYPEDQVDKKGNKFWSGAKRAPTPIAFDLDDETHMGFVVAAANLLAFNFRIPKCTDMKLFREVIPSVTTEAFAVDKNVKIAANDAEAKEMAKNKTLSGDHDTQVAAAKAALPMPADLKTFTADVVDFEKDDDENFHMDFITACSNLRARNYKIKEESKHQTKFIAGKIIPAIATTTAMVTGLVCLEMFKTLQEGITLERYRNVFANLAISHFVFGEPFAPPAIEVKKNDGELWKFTLWDRIDIKVGRRMYVCMCVCVYV